MDEAYRLTSAKEDRRGREIVEQIMATMLSPPPAPLIVFAGYEKEMQNFLTTNPGIESRISYHFNLAAYEPEDLARIFLLYIRNQGFMLDIKQRAILDPQDLEAVNIMSAVIEQQTSRETRSLYNGRLCQHVFCSAKRSLDRRTSAAIRELGLSAAEPREIEKKGLVTNTLLLDDVISGLCLLEDKARAGRVLGSMASRPSPAADACPPRGMPIQTVRIDVRPSCTATAAILEQSILDSEASIDSP